MTFLSLLPLAFVMIAGPQILSSIFLATSEGWKRNSAAYALGAALAISIVVTAAFLLGGGISDEGDENTTLYVIILVLLAAAMHPHLSDARGVRAAEVDGKAADRDPRLLLQARIRAAGLLPDRHPHLGRRRFHPRGQGRVAHRRRSRSSP